MPRALSELCLPNMEVFWHAKPQTVLYSIPALTGDVALPESPLTKRHTHKVRKGSEVAGAP
jgi:hypothetical protein